MSIVAFPETIPPVPADAKICAGAELFIGSPHNLKECKLFMGREKRGNVYNWMGFGGKRETLPDAPKAPTPALTLGETLAETACREFNEEAGGCVTITLDQVLEAEKLGNYVPYYNPKTNNFYMMYCVFVDEIPDITQFSTNEDHVEKDRVRLFNAGDIIFNTDDGYIAEVDEYIYSTALIRYKMLRDIELK